jgi:hypothetical protein
MKRRHSAVMKKPTTIATTQEPSLATAAKHGLACGVGNVAAQAVVGSLFSKVERPKGPEVPIAYTQCMKDFEDKEACKYLLNNNNSHSF